MRKFRVGGLPADIPDNLPSGLKAFLTAILEIKVGKEAVYNGFDQNLEGAKWIAVVTRPCGCCTTTFALDDDAESMNELKRMFDTELGGLQIPGRPSEGDFKLLGLYRKMT